jgi:hypothetical protein
LAETPDVDQTVRRIEQLVEEQPEAAELVQLLMQLYGAGLERVLAAIREENGAAILDRLAKDKLVASLLLLHGLHPVDAETRVRNALRRVDRRLESQRVVLAEIKDGVARIRVERDGGGAAPANVAELIERAVFETAPDLAVEIEGVDSTPALVQIAPARSAA